MTLNFNGKSLGSKVSTGLKTVKSHTPHTTKAWLVIILAGLIVAAAIYFFTRPKTQSASIPNVEVETVGTANVNIYGEYVGRIRAQQFVEIHARVEGYLESMLFKEGSYIEKGQTLFVIDPRLYKAHVNKARAQLNKARAQAQKAERDLSRIKPLYAQNAASQLDLDNATAAYESATAEVIVSEADLTQAELTLGYTRVSSPISGYISERVADIGTLVGPSGGKSLLATVVKSDSVRVDFSMTALDYLRSKDRNVNLGDADAKRKWNSFVTITLADGSGLPPTRDLSTSPIRRSTRRPAHSPYAPRCLTRPQPAAGRIHKSESPPRCPRECD